MMKLPGQRDRVIEEFNWKEGKYADTDRLNHKGQHETEDGSDQVKVKKCCNAEGERSYQEDQHLPG